MSRKNKGPDRGPSVTWNEYQATLRSQSEEWTDAINAIVRSDNVTALRDLVPYLNDSVRCAYIDPPYNGQESFTHYDDRGAREIWLDSILACVEQLWKLLARNGSLWVSIDDRHMHYLKVALDGVLGEQSFVTTVVWQQRTTRENRKVFSNDHEYILVYARDQKAFKADRNGLPLTAEFLERYKNPDNDPRGPWQSVSANAQAGHATPSQFYEVLAPGGRRHSPPKGRCWAYTADRMRAEIADGRVWFGADGTGVPRIKKYLSETKQGLTPHTLWLADQVGTNDEAKKHVNTILSDQEVFDTPKPERLLKRIIEISTSPGDIVVDAYLGSGTTAAVAHKLGRRYIGIEIGDHVATHCVGRLRAVLAGEKGGISSEVGWSGGGAFSFVGEALAA